MDDQFEFGSRETAESISERLYAIANSAKPYGEGWFVKGDLNDLRAAGDALFAARELVGAIDPFINPSTTSYAFTGVKWPLHEQNRVAWERIEQAMDALELLCAAGPAVACGECQCCRIRRILQGPLIG